jgi:hypothetical protein
LLFHFYLPSSHLICGDCLLNHLLRFIGNLNNSSASAPSCPDPACKSSMVGLRRDIAMDREIGEKMTTIKTANSLARRFFDIRAS